MQVGSPATHVSRALTMPGLHSLDTSHPAQGTSHPPHLPLDQHLNCHPTHDSDALISSDALPIPAAMSDNIKETMTANSVYSPPVPWVKDASYVSTVISQASSKTLSLVLTHAGQ